MPKKCFTAAPWRISVASAAKFKGNPLHLNNTDGETLPLNDTDGKTFAATEASPQRTVPLVYLWQDLERNHGRYFTLANAIPALETTNRTWTI